MKYLSVDPRPSKDPSIAAIKLKPVKQNNGGIDKNRRDGGIMDVEKPFYLPKCAERPLIVLAGRMAGGDWRLAGARYVDSGLPTRCFLSLSPSQYPFFIYLFFCPSSFLISP